MKNNLISAIAGWKSAALLALVAMVAAVAFSGVLTTDAQTKPGASATATSTSNAGLVRFEIDGLSTSSGSFDANGEQVVICANGGACDTAVTRVNPGDADTDADIAVKLNIDADAPDGYIVVKVTDLLASGGPAVTYQNINVVRGQVPGSLSAAASLATIDAETGSTGSDITATVKDDSKDRNGQNGILVQFVTTNGVLDCPSSTGGTNTIAAASNVQACSVYTTNSGTPAADGNAVVTLAGAGRSGVATVTVSSGTLDPQTVEVTLFGDPTAISAAAEQSSVAFGDTVFVVLTVTDDAGVPVSGETVAAAAKASVVGPDEDASGVTVVTDAGKNLNPDDSDPATTNDDSDFIDTGEYPPCDGAATGGGTNAAGQCVAEVSVAGDNPDTPANEAATRGTWTLTFSLAGSNEKTQDSAEIEVGGAPASISSDAPAYVDSLSRTPITITVVDDENVRVGAVDIKVEQVEGAGTIAAQTPAQTSDGEASFTYLASLSEGSAVFLVTAGSGPGAVQDTITVNIGSAPEEAPVAPPATWNKPLASGTHNLVWNGEDGAAPADGAGAGVTAIWQWNGSGWDGHFPAAADVPGGNTLSSLSNGEAYWVIVE